MAKKSKLIPILGINTGLLACALILGCVAWFSVSDKFEPYDVKSSIITSYFDSRDDSNPADGSMENPFVISKPVHYYNLVHLQETDKAFNVNGDEVMFYEAGFWFEFGKDFDGDGDKEFYYYDDAGHYVDNMPTNYLNMNYYYGENALPPLGSPTHPFMSHIIGNNLTVQNLHITGSGCSDIGIFGYVGQGATIEKLYFDTVELNIVNTDTSGLNSKYHPSAHTETNVGFIAGHVFDNHSFVNVYINNCKIRNSDGLVHGQNNDYGYFGYAEGNSNPVPSGSESKYEFHADKIYDYLDKTYANYGNAKLHVRADDYTPDGGAVVSSALSQGNDSFDLHGSDGSGSATGHHYAFSSIGYEQGAAESNLWFKEANTYKPIPQNAIVVDDEPGKAAGSYVYYNGEEWKYYRGLAMAEQTHQDCYGNTLWFSTTNFNVTEPFWSWYWNASKSYIKVGGDLYTRQSDIASHKNNPKQLSNQYNNGTYFEIMKSPGTFDRTTGGDPNGNYWYLNTSGSFYLCAFSAECAGRYMYIEKDSYEIRFDFFQYASDPDVSECCEFNFSGFDGGICTFDIRGSIYTFAFVNNKLQAVPANDSRYSPVYWSVSGAGADETAYTGDQWELVTNVSQLNDNDVVTFAYGSNCNNGHEGIANVILDKQSTNNRRSSVKVIRGYNKLNDPNRYPWSYTWTDGILCDASEIGRFTVKKNSASSFSFYDESNHGYLCAPSSTYDYMRLSIRNDDGTSKFSVNISNSSNPQAAITASSDGHNRLGFKPETGVFSCYAEGQQNVYIFKLHRGGNRYVYRCQMNYQGQWGYYGGVEMTEYNMYYSDRPMADPASADNTKKLTASPEELGGAEEAFNFKGDRISAYDSTSTVHMITGGSGGLDGWAKCTDKSDLAEGELYLMVCYTYANAGVAGPIGSNGGMSMTTGSVFENNGKIISTPDANAIQFKLEGSYDEGWTLIDNATDKELCTTGEGNVNFDDDGESGWDISINETNSYAEIKSWNTSAGQIAFYTEEGNERFSTSQRNQGIYLFRRASDIHDITWLADEVQFVDPEYNCDIIDVAHNASFIKDNNGYYVALQPNYDAKSIVAYETAGNKYGIGGHYYRSRQTGGCLTIKVKNQHSLDFGTLTVEGEGEPPDFIKGKDEQGGFIGFNDPRIKCSNSSFIPGKFQYVLSLNVYNIYNLCYCALDADGNVLSSYDVTSDQVCPSVEASDEYIDKDQIDYFILALAPTNPEAEKPCKISHVSYTFNAAQGNMVDFGLVGYRTAIYEGGESDNLGNTVKDASLVTGPILNFEYFLEAGTYGYVHVNYTYDAEYAKYVYQITFRSSANTQLIVFNYDAQKELMEYNTELMPGSYNLIAVTATPPPESGWLK